MKSSTGKTPGIKVRLARDGHLQLLDRVTGLWLASVRWRPRGEMWFELSPALTLVKRPTADSTKPALQ